VKLEICKFLKAKDVRKDFGDDYFTADQTADQRQIFWQIYPEKMKRKPTVAENSTFS